MRTSAIRVLIVLAVLVIGATGAIAAGPIGTAPEGSSPVYNPKKVYPGDYNADVLLYRIQEGNAWQRAKGLDRLRYITCRDALEQLQRQGRWQGHLNRDGSCGTTAEPADWVLGNRLNYEDSLE